MSRRVILCLAVGLAALAGLLGWIRLQQVVTELSPAEIKFGEIHNLDFDPATGIFEVTGPDPYGYLVLPRHVIPLLELRMDFEGAYRPGGWYIYPCPAHLPNPIINQDWVVTAEPTTTPAGHALIWTLDRSQLARIDFPDELNEPMKLEQIVLTTGYSSSRSLIYLGALICGGLALILACGHLFTAYIHHPFAQLGAMLLLIVAKVQLAKDLGQTFMTQLMHDDRLFMDQGRSIFQGDWLGPFHELTLAKGPSFSLFLAASAASGWPLQFNVLLFHAAACLVFILAVSPWVKKPVWRLVLFTLLLFDPHSMSAELIGRVLRSSVHPALTLFTFAGLMGMLTRAHLSWLRVTPWGVLAGLAGAAFWYSREEGIWALPSGLMLTATAVAVAWIVRNRGWTVLAVLILLPFTVFWSARSAVKAMNHHHYGVWMGVDVLEGAFPAAYGAILRVTNPDPLSGVPATRATRALIYEHSPSFALIREQMEEHMQPKWAFAGWHRHPHARAETEIRSGWFPWALREAAARAGFYESPAKAEALWQNIADEINQAVDDGRLPGGGPRWGFFPVWENRYLGPTMGNWFRAVDLVVRSNDFKAKGIPSRGPPEDIQAMAELYHAEPVMEVGPTTTDAQLRMMVQRLYFWSGWPLTLLALVATGVLILRLKTNPVARITLAVGLAFWGGITALALVVALVETTSFVAIIGAYLGPASPLLIATWFLVPFLTWIQPPALDPS